MKLIDILLEELPKRGGWPEGVNYITQDNGFDVYRFTIAGYDDPPRLVDRIWLSQDEGGNADWHGFKAKSLADDWDRAIATREKYEAALEKAKELKMNWKYIKGGEKDFATAIPTNATHAFKHKECGHCVYTSRPELVREDLFSLIAKREQHVESWSGEGLPPVGCEFEYGFRRTKARCIAVGLCHIFASSGNHDDEGGEYEEFMIPIRGSKFYPARTEADKKRDAFINLLHSEDSPLGNNRLFKETAGAIYDVIAAGKIPGVKLED